MNEFVCIASVMGRCQCGETSCRVPPGGDSREQGDHICLPLIQEEKGRRNMKRKTFFNSQCLPKIKKGEMYCTAEEWEKLIPGLID